MKKVTSLLVVLAVFMSASCGSLLKDEEDKNTSLVGTWTGSDQDGSMTINFNSSHTYNIDGDCPESGHWDYTDTSLTITTTDIGGSEDNCGTADGSSETMDFRMSEDGTSFNLYNTGESGNLTITFYRQ